MFESLLAFVVKDLMTMTGIALTFHTGILIKDKLNDKKGGN